MLPLLPVSMCTEAMGAGVHDDAPLPRAIARSTQQLPVGPYGLLLWPLLPAAGLRGLALHGEGGPGKDVNLRSRSWPWNRCRDEGFWPLDLRLDSAAAKPVN